MKIAIDISQIIYGTGVSVYTEKLVENLIKTDKNNEYVLFGGSLRRQSEFKHYFKNVITYPLPPTLADLAWNRLRFPPIESLVGKVNVFHSSDWTQPPSSAFKVTTIHDLSFLKYPDATPKRLVKTHKRRLSIVKKEVDRIIVPSQATKNDLLDLGFKETKIRVIPEATDIKKSSIKPKSVKGSYALSVGTHPRKNLEKTIKAFTKAKPAKKLVITGNKPAQMKDQDNIVFTGFVSTKELASLYSHAELLIYPSLYEGFGLPILESYACDCPVVHTVGTNF